MKREKIDKANVEDMMHLTPMQESMLFYYLGYPESRTYYIQLELVLDGDLEPQKNKGGMGEDCKGKRNTPDYFPVEEY